MGRTEDLTRLCGEIAGLRDARRGFVQGLTDTVSNMLASFRNTHSEMAKRAGAEREAFVVNLKGLVAGLRQEFAAENAAAHNAWFGSRRATTTERTQRAAGRKSKAKATAATRY